MWLQNALVFMIVGLCMSVVTWQGIQAMRGRKSKLGSCCSKGCEGVLADQQKARAMQTQFMPVELLGRRK